MKHFICSLLFALAIAAFPAAPNALELIDQSSNVFKFQKKLADKGNVHAQYKLASMYETGEGVDLSIDNALYWYDRAAKSGLKKAEHRNTYLMIKEHGYNKKMHAAWLDSVKSDANDQKPEAMLLLGQLYRQGIGVKKNLNKSLDLLGHVSVLGDADVEDEIESIHAEISAANNARQTADQKKQVISAVNEPVVAKTHVTQKTVEQKNQKAAGVSITKVDKQAVAEQRSQAEKVRRYEKAMMKLKREQKIIDDQQASVAGGEVASVDDEF
ncbi:MAG: sel1 repeat family protein [Gammaproteobacteria bacterium]|nr:sel1 repeat family protein [Gammaproteobacteria bacterium]